MVSSSSVDFTSRDTRNSTAQACITRKNNLRACVLPANWSDKRQWSGYLFSRKTIPEARADAIDALEMAAARSIDCVMTTLSGATLVELIANISFEPSIFAYDQIGQTDQEGRVK